MIIGGVPSAASTEPHCRTHCRYARRRLVGGDSDSEEEKLASVAAPSTEEANAAPTRAATERGGSESGVEDEETAVIAAQIVARIVAGKEPVRSGAAAMSLQETLERHAKIALWDAMDDRARALVEVARLIAAAKSGSLQHPDILRVIDARAIHISPLLRQRYKELLMDTAIEWATRDLKDFGKVRGKAAEAP